jgi:diadenosine tetraphosphate (Ap4A) HIT family hydrolase
MDCPNRWEDWKVEEASEKRLPLTIEEGERMKIVVPVASLAARSVRVIPKEWHTRGGLQETYKLLQKIAWTSKEAFMIYNKTHDLDQPTYEWEFVPYPKKGFSFWHQLKVLTRIVFKEREVSLSEGQSTVDHYKTVLSDFKNPIEDQSGARIERVRKRKDIFCKSLIVNGEKVVKVIHNQCVIEGEKVNVIYPNRPAGFGKNRAHFLIVPKNHHDDFKTVSWEEYNETEKMIRELMVIYKKEGYDTVVRFHKNGERAGQTVPHWHEHVIFTKSIAQRISGYLSTLFNILPFGCLTTLSEKKIIPIVNDLRIKFKDRLRFPLEVTYV